MTTLKEDITKILTHSAKDVSVSNLKLQLQGINISVIDTNGWTGIPNRNHDFECMVEDLGFIVTTRYTSNGKPWGRKVILNDTEKD